MPESKCYVAGLTMFTSYPMDIHVKINGKDSEAAESATGQWFTITMGTDDSSYGGVQGIVLLSRQIKET